MTLGNSGLSIMTKRLVASVLTSLSIAAATAFAQDKVSWQSFQPLADEFSVDAPIRLSSIVDKDLKASRKYYGFVDGTYIFIFSDSKSNAYYVDTVMRFIKSQNQTMKIENKLNNPLHFKDEFGYWHSIVGINTKSRIYVAQTTSIEEHTSTESRFISSFMVTKQRDLPSKTVSEDSAESSSALKGEGSARDSVSGSGSGVGANQTSPVQSNATSPLKIISKARPSYTDYARVYEINGTVIARVTFLASGQIGAVSVVRGLPFGLSEQAVLAAKRMTFQPKVVNGVPISVTKLVEYNFSIY